MGVSIRTIRAGLLTGAALLLATLVGVLAYARFKAGQLPRNLASRLGVDVKQETNGFTYSQSSKGRTVFTIHASKAVQRQDGKVMLHDVAITLFGRDGDRADQIYGDEFEYDQSTGEARGRGEIRLDLVAPASASRGKAQGTASASSPPGDRVLHVKTQGLLFQQKAGLASTAGLVQFSSGGLAGRAVGASYDSQTGKLILESAVEMTGTLKKNPGHLIASHGEFEQFSHLTHLTNAVYNSADGSVAAASVTIETTGDGTPQTLQAAGQVVITKKDVRVDSARMDVTFSESGKPRTSHLSGDVRLSKPGDEVTASDAQVLFDDEGRASHIVLDGSVHGASRRPASTRILTANRIECTLLPDGPARSQVTLAKATGSPTLRELSGASGAVIREVAADTLVAHFTLLSGKAELTSFTGAGKTVLHQVAADGTDERSAGDNLDVNLLPGKRETLLSADQRGDVKLVRVLGKSGGTQRSDADDVFYDADNSKVILRGRAHVEDASSAVDSKIITVDRISGETVAEGNVRVRYTQPATAGVNPQNLPEPIHIASDRAVLRREEQTATFYGTVGRPARIWEAGSQVEAPVLDLYQASRRLIARREGTVAVHALLTNTAQGDGIGKDGPLSVTGDRITYSDVSRDVDLAGHVSIEDHDGNMTADHAIVYLADPVQKTPGTTPIVPALPGVPRLPSAQVQRIVATGTVRVQQPDRRVEGERLVYTADDKSFVVTGTKAAQPRFFDQTRGMVTGGTLRFRSGDGNVLVSGEDGPKGAGRVRSETRMKQ